MHGQTRVYCNQSTTPLIHWPFRQQTAKRSEVSPEVNLMGWPRLKCLGPGSGHPTSFLLLPRVTRSAVTARRSSLLLATLSTVRFLPTRKSHGFFSRRTTSTYSQYLLPYRIAAHRRTTTPSQRQTLSSQYRAPQLLCRCDIASLRYSTSTTGALTLAMSTREAQPPGSYTMIKQSFRNNLGESLCTY